MQELTKQLQEEIEALDDLDARALHRKYPAILKEAKGCSISSVLRGMVAYALQDGFYATPLSKEAATRLADAGETPVRQFAAERGAGAGARLVRFWQGERHEAIVRDDGHYEYNGKTYNSLSAVAKAITGTHWNGKLFFGFK